MENIFTDRLIIRRFEENDWKDLYEYLSDKEVVKFDESILKSYGSGIYIEVGEEMTVEDLLYGGQEKRVPPPEIEAEIGVMREG